MEVWRDLGEKETLKKLSKKEKKKPKPEMYCTECKLSYNLEMRNRVTKKRIFDRNIDLLQAKKD